MAKSSKRARHITVEGTAFYWRATGNDGWISLVIWPAVRNSPVIAATFRYRETWLPGGCGLSIPGGDQIVVTNRIVRRVILHALERCAYDPTRKGPLLRLPHIDDHIDMSDAIRASASGASAGGDGQVRLPGSSGK